MVTQLSATSSILRIRSAIGGGFGLGGGLTIALTLRGFVLVGAGIGLLLGLTRTRLASFLTLPLLLSGGELRLAQLLGLGLGRSELFLILLRRRLACGGLGIFVRHGRLLVIGIRGRRRLLISGISRRRRLLGILLGRNRLGRGLLRINNARLLRIIRLGVGHASPLGIGSLRFGGFLGVFLLLQLGLASPLTLGLKPLGLGGLGLFGLASLVLLLTLDFGHPGLLGLLTLILRQTRLRGFLLFLLLDLGQTGLLGFLTLDLGHADPLRLFLTLHLTLALDGGLTVLLGLLTLTTGLLGLVLLGRRTLLGFDLGLTGLLALFFQTLGGGNLRFAMRCNRLLMLALEHGGLVDNQLALGPQALRLGRIRDDLFGHPLHLFAGHLLHLLHGEALGHHQLS